MIFNKLFFIKNELQEINSPPDLFHLGSDKNFYQKININIMRTLSRMFLIGKRVKIENYYKVMEGFPKDNVFNFDPSLSYLPYILDGTWVFDKNLYQIFLMNSYGYGENFLKDIKRSIFDKVDIESNDLHLNSKFDINSKIEMELLLSIWSLKMLLGSVYQKSFFGFDNVSFYQDTISSIGSFISPRKIESDSFFSQYKGRKHPSLVLLNYNFKLVEDIFIQVSKRYGFQKLILSKFIENMINVLDPSIAIKETYQWMKDYRYESKENYFLFYILWKMFKVEKKETLLSSFSNLFSSKSNSNDPLILLYRELLSKQEEFSDKLLNSDVMLFIFGIELIFLYDLTFSIYINSIEQNLKRQGIFFDYMGWKFFNKEYYTLLENMNISLKKYLGATKHSPISLQKFGEMNNSISITQYVTETGNILTNKKLVFGIDGQPKEKQEKVERIKAIKYSQEKKDYTLNKNNLDINNEKIVFNIPEMDNSESIKKNEKNDWIKEDISEEKTNNYLKKMNISPKRIFELLKKDVVGQDGILWIISKKIYSYIFLKKINTEPLCLFFMGPSGSGKTYLAKTIVKVLNTFIEEIKDEFIAQEENVTKYLSKENLSTLVGTTAGLAGYGERLVFFENLMNGPNHIIFFDEIEKGTNTLYKLFLDFMNNGTMESADKRYKVYMGNSNFNINNENINKLEKVIMIFASNCYQEENEIFKVLGLNQKGQEKINKNIMDIKQYEQKYSKINKIFYESLKKYNGKNGGIDPAFIDRLDSIYFFNELSIEDKQSILNKKFEESLITYNLNDNQKNMIREKFKNEFSSLENVKKLEDYESMRGFKRYIEDWVSNVIQIDIIGN